MLYLTDDQIFILKNQNQCISNFHSEAFYKWYIFYFNSDYICFALMSQ